MTALQDVLPPEQLAVLQQLRGAESDETSPPVAICDIAEANPSPQPGAEAPVVAGSVDHTPSERAQTQDSRIRALAEQTARPAGDPAHHLSGNTGRPRSENKASAGRLDSRPAPPRPPSYVNDSGGTPMSPYRIRVALHGRDVISRTGVIGQLRPRPEVLLLDDTEADQAEVTLVVADTVDEPTLRILRALYRQGNATTVLVVADVDDAGLIAAAEHGVVGIVRRSEASPDRLVTAIRAAATGDGSLPPDLLGRLLNQVGTLQRNVLAPRGLVFNGLRDREIEVLRLVADGYDTREIAAKLSYSQRTIKHILHDVTTRFCLRNRCHAVAYALRNGLI